MVLQPPNTTAILHYIGDPRQFVKKEGAGKVLGKWAERQDFGDTSHPFFIVMGKQPDGRILVAVDLDNNSQQGDLTGYCEFYGLPTEIVFHDTPNDGFHLIGEVDHLIRNKQQKRDEPGRDSFKFHVDIRGQGGLLFGPGTFWKDAPRACKFHGEITGYDAVPQVETWRVVWASQWWDKYSVVPPIYSERGIQISIGEFLAGRVDPHAMELENEFLLWLDSLYFLEDLGYTKDEIQGAFSRCVGYDAAKTRGQLQVYYKNTQKRQAYSRRWHASAPKTKAAKTSEKMDGPIDLRPKGLTDDCIVHPERENWYDVALAQLLQLFGIRITYLGERSVFCDAGRGCKYAPLDDKDVQIAGALKHAVDGLYIQDIQYGKKEDDRDVITYKKFTIDGSKLRLLQKFYADKTFTTLDDYDPPTRLLCQNGVLDVSTLKMLPAHPWNGMFLNQLPVKFLGTKQPTPNWDILRSTYPDVVAGIEGLVYDSVTQNSNAEMEVYLVGETGSGKGTCTQIIDAIFGDLCSHTKTNDMGTPFGKARLVGKRVNLDRELVIGYLSRETVAFKKDAVTHEGKIEVNEKNKPQYEYFFNIWFVGASNQLPMLPQNTDRTAFFRRVWVYVLDKTQKKNPEFKAAVLAEADAIFTNILLTHPHIHMPEDVPAHVHEMAELWDYWSDPVLRICKTYLRYVNDPMKQLDADILARLVENELAERQIDYKFDQVKSKTTAALGTMKIKKTSNRRFYRCIGFIPDVKDGANEWEEAYWAIFAEEEQARAEKKAEKKAAKQKTLEGGDV